MCLIEVEDVSEVTFLVMPWEKPITPLRPLHLLDKFESAQLEEVVQQIADLSGLKTKQKKKTRLQMRTKDKGNENLIKMCHIAQ